VFVNFVFLAGLTFGETSNYLTPSKYSLQLRTNGLQDVSSLLPGTTISIKKMITHWKEYEYPPESRREAAVVKIHRKATEPANPSKILFHSLYM